MLRRFVYTRDGRINWRNLILVGGAVVVSVIALSIIRDLRRPPAQAEVEKELAEIIPPSAATATQHNSINKKTHGIIGNYYRADLTYNQIRAYYDRELARHGWIFRKQISVTSWGKDLGESLTIYCKGDRAVDIYFTGDAQRGFRYALNVTWGFDYCD